MNAVIDHYGPVNFLTLDEDAHPEVVELSDQPGSSAARFLGFAPSSQPDEAGRADLCTHVGPGSPPFLIAHGDSDRRVGIGQSRRLHTALAEAGTRSELIVVPGADHGTPEFDEPPLHEGVLDFLAAVLGPAEPIPVER